MKIILIICFLFSFRATSAQDVTIYYSPVQMPPQLRSDYFGGFDTRALAEDLSDLLCCATGRTYNISPYRGEKNGIFLLLDPSLRDSTHETGHLNITSNSIIIRSKYSTGISFAMYSWLQDQGFRFYLPGETWMYIPKIKNIFQPAVKKYEPHFRLRLFNASGGSFPVPGIDDSGLVKKEWETWYRRNRMGSDYMRIDGHKGELFNIVHKKEIEADPAILAPYEGSRKYAVGAKLDPTYKKGVDLFTNWLANEFVQTQKTIPDFLPFKKYQSADMGDGLNYCHTPACEERFESVSEQSIYLTNEAAKKIRSIEPGGGVSTLAYTERADTSGLKIEPNVHIMVVPGAFQQTGIPSDLMLRWRKKHHTISQYDFLNIGVWHFDHPFFNLAKYHEYLEWMKEMNIEGFSMETSLSSMASGLQQHFIMQYLAQPYSDIDREFHRFCEQMFGKATVPVTRILKAWYFSDAHLKTSLEKPSFYPDELARFIHDIREAENTKGLQKAERERISLLKAYIIYLCGFYELYHEPLPTVGNALAMKDLKAEALLKYTWSLYQQRLFHNTQLNDLLKKSTKEPFRWDFRSGSLVRSVESLTIEQIEKNFLNYEVKYGAFLSEEPPLTAADKRNLVQFAADSIRIKTLDEKAFGSFTYALKVYAPGKGKILIRYVTGKGTERKSVKDAVAVMALETSGGKLLQKHASIKSGETGWAELSVPGEGEYNLQLGQFHATPVEWVVLPGGNLFYIEKKQVIHHAIALTENQGSAYDNTQLAIWNNGNPFTFQPVFENVKNTVSFYSAENERLEMIRNASKNHYQVAPVKTAYPFLFYRNEVARWPAVLQNVPPYFFFLRKQIINK